MNNPFRETPSLEVPKQVAPEEEEREDYIRKQTQQFLKLKERGLDIAQLMRLLGPASAKYYEDVSRGDELIGKRFRFKDFLEDESTHEHRVALPDLLHEDKQVFVPPDAGEIPRGTGQEPWIREMIPRTRFFMELINELGLTYSVHHGKSAPGAFRQTPYDAFVILEKRLIVLLNNEASNATFVIHHETDYKNFASMTKSALKALGGERVTELHFRDADIWKKRIRQILEGKRKSVPPPHPEGGYEVAPSGWETAGHLREVLVNNNEWIDAELEKIRREHPEWFHVYYSRTRGASHSHSKPAEHISPEAVDMLHTLLEKELVPEGWTPLNALVSRIGLSYGAMNNRLRGGGYLKKFRTENRAPGQPMFGVFATYVSPEGVRALEAQYGTFDERPQAPEGWKTFSVAALEIGIDAPSLREWCQSKADENILRIKKYWSPASSKMADFLSPELFALAKERWRHRAPNANKDESALIDMNPR